MAGGYLYNPDQGCNEIGSNKGQGMRVRETDGVCIAEGEARCRREGLDRKTGKRAAKRTWRRWRKK